MKVLIADDSRVVRRNLKKLIASVPGIEAVHETDTVSSTLKQLADEIPDVLILDIQMPDGTGIEVLDSQSPNSPRPVVIVLTNYPSESNRSMCLSRGADYFFDKSNEYERIIDVLNECTRSRS